MKKLFGYALTFSVSFAFLLPVFGQKARDALGTKGSNTEPSAQNVNSLGMEFVKVGNEGLFFCKWEVRVRDYKPFTEELKVKWQEPTFEQGDDHPAVNVSWEDAVRFCRWLTSKEHASGKLPSGAKYRLPTSREWSLAAGLSGDGAEAKKSRSFAWGDDWPPPLKAGNYAQGLGVDSFTNTAPVGSFPANSKGLYDLGGNVWEWCSDNYERAIDFHILRGASWRMRNASDLLLANRIGNLSGLRLPVYGFRVALEK